MRDFLANHHTFMRDFLTNHHTFMRDFLANRYTFMRDFPQKQEFHISKVQIKGVREKNAESLLVISYCPHVG